MISILRAVGDGNCRLIWITDIVTAARLQRHDCGFAAFGGAVFFGFDLDLRGHLTGCDRRVPSCAEAVIGAEGGGAARREIDVRILRHSRGGLDGVFSLAAFRDLRG